MARRPWSWSAVLIPLGVLASGLTCSRGAVIFFAESVAYNFCTKPACRAAVNEQRLLWAVIGLLGLAVFVALIVHSFRRRRAPEAA